MRQSVIVPAAVATACLVVLACAAALLTGRPSAPVPLLAPGTTTTASGAAEVRAAGPAGSAGPRAVAVLRAWDRRRSRAWARGDRAALRALYAPASAAGAADVAMLGAWRERGLRVRELRAQVLRVEVVREGPRRLLLRVTDRVRSAVAVGPGVRRRLPASPVATRLVALRLVAGRWRVQEVRRTDAAAPGSGQASAAATTSRTSRSWKA